jgi:hypothetical protein
MFRASGGSEKHPAGSHSRKEAFVKALEEGQYIKHFQYGLGVVTESDPERTSIDFDLHGPKKFVTSLMVVELSDLTPPKRARARRTKKASVAGSPKKAAAGKAPASAAIAAEVAVE